MIRRVCLLLVAAGVIVNCGRHPVSWRQILYLVDATASVPTETRTQSLAAVRDAFRTLRRGDRVTIVPIASDAQMDGPQRILRFRLPVNREPYDADLQRVADDAEAGLRTLLTATTQTPFMHTDLLGALELAIEELARGDASVERVLVVLSDFIQDDSQYDFKHDPRLTDVRRAKSFVTELAHDHPTRLQHVVILLGSLPSDDLRRLSKSRRDAIRTFWIELLTRQGASVHWATDGPGHLGEFLEPATRLDNRQPKE